MQVTQGDGVNREEIVFRHTFECAAVPFIAAIRKDLGWQEGEAIPDHMAASLWLDGKREQLLAVVGADVERTWRENRTSALKHDGARTAGEQSNDAMDGFKHHRQLSRLMNAKQGPACAMRKRVEKTLQRIASWTLTEQRCSPHHSSVLNDSSACLGVTRVRW